MSINQPVNQRGAALITSLITIVIVAGIALLMFNRMMAEMSHSRDNVAITQTMMLARGGANVGGEVLNGLRDEIQTVVAERRGTTGKWMFGDSTSTTATAPDAVLVATDLQNVAHILQQTVDTTLCADGANFVPTGSSATVTVRVFFTGQACNKELPAKTRLPEGRFISGTAKGAGAAGPSTQNNQTYALPFVMVSEAKQGNYKRNIVLQGEFQFGIGRQSFANFAYFTNRRTVNGEPVFFANNDMVDGPVHSNEYLRFSGTPWFGSKVTVAGCVTPSKTECGTTQNAGDFLNGTTFRAFTSKIDSRYTSYCGSEIAGSDPPATVPCPTFEGDAVFNADYIKLPTNNLDQKGVAQGSGIYFANTLKDLKLSVLEEGGKTYQVIEAQMCANAPVASAPNDLTCNTPITTRTFRYSEPEVLNKGFPLEEKVAGAWQAYKKSNDEQFYFKGVVFTDGGIANLGGPARTGDTTNPDNAPDAVASFAQMTVASTGKTLITRDLKYQDPPCTGKTTRTAAGVTKADCSNKDARNVLGIYAQRGDVLFGTGDSNTLLDLTVHASVLSGEGRVGTNNWNTVSNQRTFVNVLGGLIGETVAGFYHTNGGYQRNVTYDQRFSEGLTPPQFPTNDSDTVQPPTFVSFGQREQVY
jgi:hypothetical protein